MIHTVISLRSYQVFSSFMMKNEVKIDFFIISVFFYLNCLQSNLKASPTKVIIPGDIIQVPHPVDSVPLQVIS